MSEPRAMSMTGHPLQRAGAWAVAVLSERRTPHQVNEADLDEVADRLVEDVTAAATADKGTAAYDWWKILFALYPNSKATHSKRPRDRAVLRASVGEMFRSDHAQVPVLPCTFCDARTSIVWTKTNLPMFDTNKALNTLPPGIPGWPVCRGCRIAAWALPYGSWVTAGSATVLACETEAAERVFAERNVMRARRIMHLGFKGVSATARAELIVVQALHALSGELCGSTLWSFKNDNQEPWLRVTRTRRAVPLFLATVQGNAPLRRAWRLLEIALTRRDEHGDVTVSGSAEAARSLFEAEDGRSRSLLLQLHQSLHDSDRSWSPGAQAALTELAFTYAEEVLSMAVDNVAPVAEMIADWIEYGSGKPRSRLAQYRKVALNSYQLGVFLVEAQFRLKLDGRPLKARPEDWAPLVGQHPRSWEQRMLLAGAVLTRLQERGVAVHEHPVEAEEQAQFERQLEEPILGFDDNDELGAA